MRAEAGLLSARLALGWLISGEVRAHPSRFPATAVAIAIGVALGFAPEPADKPTGNLDGLAPTATGIVRPHAR